MAPEFCQAIAKKSSLKRREAERRQARLPLAASADAAARPALTRARSPLGAPPRLWSQRERCDPIQAALHASERMRALPAPSFALKRGTSRTGHNAGGDDARTARERGYKPRPQEPHSLHVQVCLENTPFDERDGAIVTLLVTMSRAIYHDRRRAIRSSWPGSPRPFTSLGWLGF
jgi:hypothetical protein